MVKPLANIALVEPEIPNNTGNIGRTCVAMNCHLHLIGPLGFEVTDKQVKRSGLDYWPNLTMTQYDNISQWEKKCSLNDRFFYFTTKAEKSFHDVDFKPGDWLVFGPESRGLPIEFLEKRWEQAVTIPMLGPTRSLNLANAVSVAIFELYRQSM